MPLTTFSPDNVRTSPTSFPKVKLGKGEKARIVCCEKQPAYEWIHELKKPMFSKVTGQPLLEKRERSNGEEYETQKLDFVGRPICHGDPDILEDQGIDPDHCYACKYAKETDYVSPPVRRYAIHVLQYATETGSTQIVLPFTVQTRVWTLTEKRFAEMVELMNEAKTTDPRTIDILLTQKGPETFQQYEMQLGRVCELMEDPTRERLQRGVETYKSNHAPDLVPFCGKAVAVRYLQEDVDSIIAAWRRVREYESGAAPSGTGVPASNMSAVDASLLDEIGSAGSGSKPAQVATTAPVDDLWGDGLGSSSPAAQQAPASTQAPASAPAPGWEEFDSRTTSVTEEDARSMPTPSSVRPAEEKPAPSAVADFDALMDALGE